VAAAARIARIVRFIDGAGRDRRESTGPPGGRTSASILPADRLLPRRLLVLSTPRTALAALAALALAACSDGGGGGTGTALISATAGGSVEIEGTSTRLTIPPEALEIDTEVTVQLDGLDAYGELDDGVDDVLVIEPTLILGRPAELLFDVGDAVDADMALSIRQWSDQAWIQPEISSARIVSGGLVATTLTQLAPPADVAVPPPGVGGRVIGAIRHIYTGDPLPGLGVTVFAGGARVGTAVSDDAGDFEIVDVPAGQVEVAVSVAREDNCFDDPTTKLVQVTAGAAAEVTFGFVPGPC
jgi:hypothetical protein